MNQHKRHKLSHTLKRERDKVYDFRYERSERVDPGWFITTSGGITYCWEGIICCWEGSSGWVGVARLGSVVLDGWPRRLRTVVGFGWVLSFVMLTEWWEEPLGEPDEWEAVATIVLEGWDRLLLYGLCLIRWTNCRYLYHGMCDEKHDYQTNEQHESSALYRRIW